MSNNPLKLLVKFPTRSRANKFLSVFDKLITKTSDKKNTYFVITLDDDDPTIDDSFKFIFNLYQSQYNISVDFGTSKNKIDAINRDMEKYTDWDILVLTSDDMIPIVDGYDNIIRQDMEKYHPDLDGVLHYIDGYTQLNTLPILGKKYYDRYNFIYNPIYESFFCDNEFQEIATYLKRHQTISQILFRHEHPVHTGQGNDELYQKCFITSWEKDEKTWRERKSRGYDLNV